MVLWELHIRTCAAGWPSPFLMARAFLITTTTTVLRRSAAGSSSDGFWGEGVIQQNPPPERVLPFVGAERYLGITTTSSFGMASSVDLSMPRCARTSSGGV